MTSDQTHPTTPISDSDLRLAREAAAQHSESEGLPRSWARAYRSGEWDSHPEIVVATRALVLALSRASNPPPDTAVAGEDARSAALTAMSQRAMECVEAHNYFDQLGVPREVDGTILHLNGRLNTHLLAAAPPVSNRLRADAGWESLIQTATEQVAYWRDRQSREKCLDDGLDEDGNYTPIGDDAAWSGGHCNGRYSEADWWLKTITLAASKALPPQEARAIIDEMAQAKPVERVRHLKRGTEYEVLHRGVELQIASHDVVEGSPLVIYQGTDGKLWAREECEFDDGRFEPLPHRLRADADAEPFFDQEAIQRADKRYREDAALDRLRALHGAAFQPVDDATITMCREIAYGWRHGDADHSLPTLAEHFEAIADELHAYRSGRLAPASSGQGDADGWRSMDSAPKDGRIIGVEGGCAFWDVRGFWATAVGDDYGRPIQWDVRRWKDLSPLPAAPVEPGR